MATTSKTVYADYTNISSIKSYWREHIAPNYFDFNNANNYNIGIFGYVNEIMANSVEDSFNATAIARREFYPNVAQFTSSLYAMATLQSIEIPLTKPATCRCVLIIPQHEIIENSTVNGNLYECTIDNCLKIFAGDLQFMLDYPIKIISKKTNEWSHTIHYDISVSNSLNTATDIRYISNKIIKEDGINYVALFIDCIRQLEMTEVSNIVIKDSVMDTITMDIDFDGNLANFEVFYKDNANSEEVQLQKVMINGPTPTNAYVKYELVNTNRIRLTFAYNTIFTPKYNSEIICRIYTSRGAEGNFNSFAEDLVCSSDSDKYPYNSTMTILGKVNGSATGGADQLLTEDFRNQILKAYSTNNTITTSNDLQLHFDDIANDVVNTKVLFKKKRDDPLIRLFGAYCVIKDEGENVIPTNTLNLEFLKSDFVDDLTSSVTRLSIKPGTIFEYKNDDSYVIIPSKNEDGSLKTILDIQNEESSDKMYFTNPFLIGISLTPNNVGYYMISNDQYFPIEYTYVNDDSAHQFIGGTLSMYRNSIGGANYYRFRISLTSASDIDYTKMITINDPEMSENQIRAKYNGRVINEEYYFDTTKNTGYIRFTLEYDTDNESQKFEYIQASNTFSIIEDEFGMHPTSSTGYKMLLKVGDTFVSNTILATKRVTDLSNLMICGNLNYNLHVNGYYIPFTIQDYDETTSGYIMEGYIATNDEIDLSEKLTITHGIYDRSGNEKHSLSIDMRNQILEMNVLYNNEDLNGENKYRSFNGLNNYTLTNSFINNENKAFDFIGTLPFVRSVVDFAPGGTSTGDYKINIKETPLIGALWATNQDHYDYFISKYNELNNQLNGAYYMLENNFSIDSKFYNTYGKARFFIVGNNSDYMVKLDSVRCKFHFGVKLNTIASTDQFITNFRNYIQNYIENDNKITTSGQDLFIMNLISELRTNFSEIAYLEYYGFNSYDYMAQKVVGPDLTDYREEFIPEFLNLDIVTDINGNQYPNVIVDILT